MKAICKPALICAPQYSLPLLRLSHVAVHLSLLVILLLRQALEADVSPCTLTGAALLVLGAVAVRSAGSLLFGVTIRQEKRPRGPARLRNKATVNPYFPTLATEKAYWLFNAVPPPDPYCCLDSAGRGMLLGAHSFTQLRTVNIGICYCSVGFAIENCTSSSVSK